jgi:hypothetical protein
MIMTEDGGQRTEDPSTQRLRRAGRQMLDACCSWLVTRGSLKAEDRGRKGN